MRLISSLLLIFFITLYTIPSFAKDVIGTINETSGSVYIQKEGQDEKKMIDTNTKIFVNDTIYTKDDASFARIDFIDGTHLTLSGEDGVLTVDEYIFDPNNTKDNRAKYSILRASFEFVGGLLDKGEKENTQINLDFGSIGIRGTRIFRTMKNNECWIYLEEGKVRVFNDVGITNLTAGEGTTISAKSSPPSSPIIWDEDKINWIKSETGVGEGK